MKLASAWKHNNASVLQGYQVEGCVCMRRDLLALLANHSEAPVSLDLHGEMRGWAARGSSRCCNRMAAIIWGNLHISGCIDCLNVCGWRAVMYAWTNTTSWLCVGVLKHIYDVRRVGVCFHRCTAAVWIKRRWRGGSDIDITTLHLLVLFIFHKETLSANSVWMLLEAILTAAPTRVLLFRMTLHPATPRWRNNVIRWP